MKNEYAKYGVPDTSWKDPAAVRDNQLVCFGLRAGEMYALGHISLPRGVCGEDIVAAAGIEAVRLWLTPDAVDPDISFDEHIERYLLDHFPKEDG